MTGAIDSDWTQSRLEQYIADGVEESLTLDYKSADSLAKTDSKRKEITKDVSAFANSAGGTIIYGVRECQSSSMKHLPERLDPVRRNEFSKEWLEHVVQNVRPRVEGVRIVPVNLDSAPDDVVYVVEIPAGETAHQAQDFRYYRRFNFESVPMADHEIRDVMNRSRCPKFEVDLAIQRQKYGEYGVLRLELFYRNVGTIYAQYVNGFVTVASDLLGDSSGISLVVDGQQCKQFSFANIHRDLVRYRAGAPVMLSEIEVFGNFARDEEYYVTRYDPVLPGLGRSYHVSFGIMENEFDAHKESIIKWILHADNAIPIEGVARLGDIRFPGDDDEI